MFARLSRVCAVALGFFVAGCATTPADYKDTTPPFDFKAFFNGPVKGHGIAYDWRGKVANRFTLKINTTWTGDKAAIDEVFTFADGSDMRRTWTIEKNGDLLTGTASDMPTGMTGEAAGFALQMKYLFDMPYQGSTIRLRASDWMYQVDPTTVINHVHLKKFGLGVGEMVIVFRK